METMWTWLRQEDFQFQSWLASNPATYPAKSTAHIHESGHFNVAGFVRVLCQFVEDTALSTSSMTEAGATSLPRTRMEHGMEDETCSSSHVASLTEHDVLSIVTLHCICLNGLGRHEEAAELEEKVFHARQHVLGNDHPQTLESMHHYGVTLRHLERHVEAAGVKEMLFQVR